MIQKVALAELPYFVRNVLAVVGLEPRKQTATVVALRGELGAGKTTFTQALARELGVTETLQSPTYVLMKNYPLQNKKFTTLVHIDAYRLSNAQEFAALRPEQFLNDPSALVVVEWPEKVAGALQEPDVTINFSSERAGGEERYIEVV